MPKTPNLGNCKKCGISVFGKRPDAQYCSDHCYNRRSTFPDKERHCKECGTVFPIVNLSDANRRYCSGACAKRATTKQVKQWTEDHPEAMREYNSNRVAKNPGAWIEKSKRGRAESLKLLGGKCIVCGVDNPVWLHIDFIPTTRNVPYRHSRGVGYIRRNLHLFRLLCANHHYELTLTGKIEGTNITQPLKQDSKEKSASWASLVGILKFIIRRKVQQSVTSQSPQLRKGVILVAINRILPRGFGLVSGVNRPRLLVSILPKVNRSTSKVVSRRKSGRIAMAINGLRSKSAGLIFTSSGLVAMIPNLNRHL